MLPVRLLASTDFALRLLTRLAAEPDRHLTAEVLAQRTGVPRNHVHKIVQDLADFGVVQTLRGPRGGVLLAKPAAEINLGAVVRRLEQGHALVECFRADGGSCCLSPDCRLRGMLGQAREAFLAELERSSLADCLAPEPAPRARHGGGKLLQDADTRSP